MLGGTAEALKLVSTLCLQGHYVVTSFAGRTKNPTIPISGEVRIGGFGGAKGLAEYIQKNEISLVVDATHPFAKQISKNAKEATKMTGVELEVHKRKSWEKTKNDKWVEVQDIQEAVDRIPNNAEVMLAIGSQHAHIFGQTSKKFGLVVRQINPPVTKIKNAKYVLSKPLNVDEEIELMASRGITHLVCRNSGGKKSYAKIEAARELGIIVVIIGRSQEDEQET